MTEGLTAHLQDHPAELTEEVRAILMELRRLRIREVSQIEQLLGIERRGFRTEIRHNEPRPPPGER